ncbi:MAG: hypothetical protein KGD58_06755 [Candidatus Lokiarchaeota archaeon]|nr:hypothetical protein [Candidatus Lokiarchaeota archaeon]
MFSKKIKVQIIIVILLISSFALIFRYKNHNNSYFNVNEQDNIHTSAQISETKQWIKNPTFESPIEPSWYWKNGTEGDNSDVNATSSPGQANFEVLGETRTFTVVSGIVNSSTSPGWKQFDKPSFLQPDTAEIRSYGCFVYHYWYDDPNQFPSVQWRTNISMPIDMSDYIITSASLEVIVNATVSSDVDTPNDGAYWENFAIGDSVTYYAQITDLEYNAPIYTVASNKTRYLGQNSPPILTLTNKSLDPVSEVDIIAALNSAFEKDSSHSNFTLTLGIDIYCEDNLQSSDPDTFNELIIKTCNLTFTVMKKIDQSTTLSWNQIGDEITGTSVQIIDANFNFKYKVDKIWPTSAPLSELRFYINNKSYDAGIIKLSSATTSFQEAKSGGFDVTDLITANVNISVSIEVFLKDTFELDEVYIISIDEVYLNISYIKTFPDYGSELQLFLNKENKTTDPMIQISYFDTLNITVTYKENETGNHISNSTVKIEGKVSDKLEEDEIFEHYYILINTSELGLGASVLTISAQKDNYEVKSVQIYIEVIEQPTELQLVIDDIQRSSKETIDVKFNELLNVTVFFKDNLTNTHINGATVNLLGIGNFSETINHYNLTLNTNDLNQGINILTIFAQLDNYQSQTIQFFINVIEIATELLMFLDGNQTYVRDTIYNQIDEFINISVYYRNNNTKEHIIGASVDLLGFGSLDELNNQYNFSLNTNDLVRGINVLTIYAQLNNYQSQTFQFFISIEERGTNLLLFIDEVQEYPSDTFNTQFDEIINITVLYRDDNTNMDISGASVELLGIGFLNETSNQYNISISTNILEKGINILTIFAQLSGYQHKTIQFFINVDDRATELLLYIDGVQLNDSDTIQVEIDENINITTLFRDKITNLHLGGASIELLGIGFLNETSNQYNITINSNDLELGINILTIFTQLNNYQPNSIQIFVDVVNKVTNLIVCLNGIDKTNDPVLTLPINSLLNLTIKYLHNQTGLEISGALLQLIGEGLIENINENVNFSQYSFILNTTNLGIGVRLFTIVAQATDFQISTVDIRITVNRISTSINTLSGETYFDISSEDDFLIQIVLNNTDFGEIIKNATVTYRWERGQGELVDLDNDGIYEVVLRNLPAGSYVIIINAYAGEDYEFETFEIILNARAKPGFDYTFIIILLSIGILGLGTYFVLYQKYFKYPPKVRKIRKLRKKISKNKRLNPISLQTRDDIIRSKIQMNKQMLEQEKISPETKIQVEDSDVKKKEGGGVIE